MNVMNVISMSMIEVLKNQKKKRFVRLL